MLYAIKRDDGGVNILVISPNTKMPLDDILKKDIPQGAEYRLIESDQLPQDRLFRNAWTDDNATATVDVDMVKARGIHMQRVRIMRDKKLKELDAEQMKVLTDVGQLQDIERLKKIFRDIPQLLDLSQIDIVEDLIKAWPVELDKPREYI